MQRIIPSLSIALALTTTLAVTTLAASPQAPSPGSGSAAPIKGPVYVHRTEIIYLESFPVQAHLAVSGSLPTPCHEPVWTVDTSSDLIAVTLWSEADADAVCASVLEPFEASIPLGDFESADLVVTLNGEDVGSVVIGTPEVPSDRPGSTTALTDAGWSFGMCAGLCRADLSVDGDAVVLRGSDRSGEEQLFENHGVITSGGRAQLDAALATLGDTPLEPAYGCPDCADGGASYLTLRRDGGTTRHDMEYGAPPAELAEVVTLSTALIDALQECRSSELVSVADDCVPWQG